MRNYLATLLSVIAMSFVTNSIHADTSIALSKNGDYYRYSKKTLKQASAEALKYCEVTTHGKCTIIYNSKRNSSGFGAVAVSKTRTGFSSGFDNENYAKQKALDECATETSRDDTCNIVLTFEDSTHPKAIDNTKDYAPQQNTLPAPHSLTSAELTKGCYQKLVTEPYTIYENKCDYNQYGPVNCQNLPTTMQQTKTVTVCN